MGNHSLKRRIAGLSKQIEIHKRKIVNEKSKKTPDYGLIHHWEKEVAAYEKSIERAKRRLGV
jgi:hypothetical protein